MTTQEIPKKQDIPANVMNDEIRKCLILMIFDISGSMTRYQRLMHEAFKSTVKGVAASRTEDMDYEILPIFFNHNTFDLNNILKGARNRQPLKGASDLVFMRPEDLLEMVDEGCFECDGGTNLTGIVNVMDRAFSRTGAVVKTYHKGDPMTLTIIVTDMEGTDTRADRDRAFHVLADNRFYHDMNQTLCIYMGSESNKHYAVAIAGNEQNIIAMDDKAEENITRFLAPVMLRSVLNLSDATHITGAAPAEKSPAETAEEEQRRAQEAEESAEELGSTSEATMAQVKQLLGL